MTATATKTRNTQQCKNMKNSYLFLKLPKTVSMTDPQKKVQADSYENRFTCSQ